MKPLVITHKNCIDGCCSKAILFSKLLDTADYLELDHSNLDESKDSDAPKYLAQILNKKNTDVYMADFCLDNQLINKLLENGNKVIVLDHHETSIKNIETFEHRLSKGEKINIEINFSKKNDKSGSMLTWEYLYPNVEPPMSIKHISAGDIWKFIYGEDTKYFYTGIIEAFEEPKNVPDSVWADIISKEDSHKQFITIGKPLRDKYMEEVMSYIPEAKSVEINGKKGLMVKAPKKYTSDLGNQLASFQNGEGFGLVYYTDDDSSVVKCSLRSIAPFTVNDIALSLGGGGHAQASAFRCDSMDEFNNIINSNLRRPKP